MKLLVLTEAQRHIDARLEFRVGQWCHEVSYFLLNKKGEGGRESFSFFAQRKDEFEFWGAYSSCRLKKYLDPSLGVDHFSLFVATEYHIYSHNKLFCKYQLSLTLMSIFFKLSQYLQLFGFTCLYICCKQKDFFRVYALTIMVALLQN